MAESPRLYGIDELADRAGVSRRTVRFYVQRGLLDAPRGLGRGKHYGDAHLQSLLRIRALQEAGVPLALIAAQLDERLDESAVAAANVADRDGRRSQAQRSAARIAVPVSLWTHVELDADVVLQVRNRVLSEEQRRALTKAVTSILRRRDNDE